MTDLTTPRLRLHPIDIDEAARIADKSPGPDDRWADDFPFEGDVGAVVMFLRATDAQGVQQPFGYYRITRLADGRAIGGIGFKGRPEGGRVEIGYGLVSSARGRGYAAEAVVALLGLAAEHGVTSVVAETTADNIPSQKTLIRAGFRPASADTELLRYEAQPASGIFGRSPDGPWDAGH